MRNGGSLCEDWWPVRKTITGGDPSAGASDAVEVFAYRRLHSASSNMAIAIFLSLFKSIGRPYGVYQSQ